VMEVRDVAMDFLYGEQFTESSPEAYERLLLDVLLGDATLFPRNAEVEASWAAIDPLEEFWAGTTPHPYRAGEWVPARRRRCWPARAAGGGARDPAPHAHPSRGEPVTELARARRNRAPLGIASTSASEELR